MFSFLSIWLVFGSYTLTAQDHKWLEILNEKIDQILEQKPRLWLLLEVKLIELKETNISEKLNAYIDVLLVHWEDEDVVYN